MPADDTPRVTRGQSLAGAINTLLGVKGPRDIIDSEDEDFVESYTPCYDMSGSQRQYVTDRLRNMGMSDDAISAAFGARDIMGKSQTVLEDIQRTGNYSEDVERGTEHAYAAWDRHITRAAETVMVARLLRGFAHDEISMAAAVQAAATIIAGDSK